MEHIPKEIEILYHRGCGGEIRTYCRMAMPCAECLKCGNEIYFEKDIIKAKFKRVGVE